MLDDSERLQGRVKEAKTKDADNSVLEKAFPGGFISMFGSNSVSNLASQSAGVVMVDDADRIPFTAGDEGDTVSLIAKRLQGRMETKLIQVSTPTVKDLSRIEFEYLVSDQRKFFVPCPECGTYQVLVFANLKGWHIAEGNYDFAKTYYECSRKNCRAHIYDRDKYLMLEKGEWRKGNPEVIDHAGFFINELYSTLPKASWDNIAREFILAKGNPHKLQVFVNTVLGETWEDRGKQVEGEELLKRCEPYPKVTDAETGEVTTLLPEGVLLLTAGADVQEAPNRIEVAVKGWGMYEESWFIMYKIFHGDLDVPYIPEAGNIWFDFETFLFSTFRHELGFNMRIASAIIDSRYKTSQVQRFVKQRERRGLFCGQGHAGAGRPILGRPSQANKYKATQFIIGVDTAKDTIYGRLTIDSYGPGYMHFPKGREDCDEEYFKQLTAEKKVTRFNKGVAVKDEWVKIRPRNEGLDCEVYALAALERLGVRSWTGLREAVKRKADTEEMEEEKKSKQKIKMRKRNYVNSWRF